MKIFSKRKTDDQYMKGIISSYNKRYYIGFAGLIISIIIFSCTYYFMNKFDNKVIAMFKDMKSHEKQPNKELSEEIDEMHYVLGARLGYQFASGVYVAIGLFILSLTIIFGQRKNKLIIELYEKSKNDESIDNVRIIKDFLPSPENLVLKSKND